MKIFSKFLFIAIIFTGFLSCADKDEENLVDLRQIQIDGSNDYGHIFKDAIEKERYERYRYKKNQFR